ncbi:F0F1 ATP synthase subunit delta [Candidatus Saccharibacteria bacterium]|nr:F0F1 ATP synthase subunit delta [Candidatus Saccharibacteria bacterium]
MPGRLSRRSIAEYIATGLIEGQSKKKLFQQLAGYLIDTQRTNELDLIVRDIEFSLAQKGTLQASVVSAFELTTETKKALEDFVKTETKATTVTLSSMIDPTVLGGVKITVPGRELDQTATHLLTVLKTRFKKA